MKSDRRTSWLGYIISALWLFCIPLSAANPVIPHLKELNGRQVLHVDGEPFLILGLQWDCDTPFSRELMDPLFPEAAKMGCNTAVVPIFWREVEPVEETYDFSMLDHRIELARRYGLRLAPVWFGAYKNGCMNYAPDYVKLDRARFRRVQTADGTSLRNFSCPTSADTFAAEQRTLRALLHHLRNVDAAHRTVVVFQMENEPGILGTDRCHCSVCGKQFEESGWRDREPDRAAEAFTAQSIARYLDGLSEAAKEVYPLPVYINAWLGSKASVPGQDYPSGGPVERVLDVYGDTIRHIDFVAPDIYSQELDSFRSICRGYSGKGWPLYIAEHSSGMHGRAEKNVFYALAEQAAIGFSPWAIDRSFPDIHSRPYVHQLDARWSEEAYDLRDSYVPIRDAMTPIAQAQGTDQLKFFVQEADDEDEARLDFEEVSVVASYGHSRKLARGMVIRRNSTEFVVLGTGFDVRFLDSRGEGIPLLRVDRGRFRGETWQQVLPVRREREDRSAPFRVIEAQVLRVVLGLPGLVANR